MFDAVLRKTMAEGGGQQIMDFCDTNYISVEGGVKLFPRIHSIFRPAGSGVTFITDILMGENSCPAANSEEFKIVELNETTDGSDLLSEELLPIQSLHLLCKYLIFIENGLNFWNGSQGAIVIHYFLLACLIIHCFPLVGWPLRKI